MGTDLKLEKENFVPLLDIIQMQEMHDLNIIVILKKKISSQRHNLIMLIVIFEYKNENKTVSF